MAGGRETSRPTSSTRKTSCRAGRDSCLLRQVRAQASQVSATKELTTKMSSGGLLATLAMKVDPSVAALIVVDVQNDFAAEGGFFHQIGADVKLIQACMPPLARLIDATDAVDVLVIFVQAIYDPEY